MKGLKKKGEAVHVPVLGRWFREHCWGWQLLAWKEGDAVLIGKPAGVEAGELLVDVLEQWSWARYERALGGSKEAWNSTAMTKERFKRGQDGCLRADTIWAWGGLAAEPWESRKLAAGRVWPVESERWEFSEGEVARVLYRVHDYGDRRGSLHRPVQRGGGRTGTRVDTRDGGTAAGSNSTAARSGRGSTR